MKPLLETPGDIPDMPEDVVFFEDRQGVRSQGRGRMSGIGIAMPEKTASLVG
jgi:hypothetical protein